jgi:hypothetical protein
MADADNTRPRHFARLHARRALCLELFRVPKRGEASAADCYDIPRVRRFVCTQCGSRKVTIRSVWTKRKPGGPFYSSSMCGAKRQSRVDRDERNHQEGGQ